MGAWGLLPLTAPLLAFVAWRLGALAFPVGDRPARAAAAVVLGMAFVHCSVGWLGQLGVLTTASLVAALAVGVVAVSLGPRLWGQPPLASPRPEARWLRRPGALAPLLAVAAVLTAAIVTARVLPIWQWDAVGYHLPFVNFVLQSRGFGQVPPDVRYLSTYPHNVELAMVWLRAMLPDDRLVDLAQVPYGAAGALLTAASARRLSASRELSLLAGAAWVCAPGVFLQLPTNYVDVGTAVALLGALFFLVLSPPTTRTLVVGGIALGLFLGSKPSAPLATALLAGVAAVRALRAGQGKALGVCALATVLFGGEMYALMLLRHGNPVWPVALKLGPLTLPGESSVDTLLAAGAASQRAGGGLLERLLTSWVTLWGQQVFDMRVGGLGALFLLALPLALWALLRLPQRLLLGLGLLASLLSPDPAMARYVLAFPALVLALAAVRASAFPARWLPPLMVLVLGVAAAQIAHAWHGLVGDGPPYSTFLSMSDDERQVALGPSGPPRDYPPLWAAVQPGESVAFDPAFEFPGLLWSPTRNYAVELVPRSRDAAAFWAWVQQRRVRVLAVGPEHAALVEARAGQWEKRFDCSSADCAVYSRR